MNDPKNTLVSELMRSQVRCVQPGDPLEPAVKVMEEADITCVIVDLKDPARGFGILTQKDVIGLLFDERVDFETTTVGEVMSHPCLALSPEWSLETAVACMRMMGVRRAPVVQAGKLLGLLSFTDVFRHAFGKSL
jgi:CBS domain-containing protein